MLFRKLWDNINKNLDEENKDFLVLVLVSGLGSVLGSVLVLVSGLGSVSGLVLVLGSVLVLVSGLPKQILWVIPIVILTLIGLYALSTDPTYMANIIIIIPITIAAAEILFIYDKQQPTQKQNKYWFTAKVKAESYIAIAFGWCVIATSKFTIDQLNVNWKTMSDAISTYGVYPLMFFGVVGFVGIYIWLNSLKYRQKKTAMTSLKENEQ